jgi:4-hydroxy-2-oxoheptanedioate aldolase
VAVRVFSRQSLVSGLTLGASCVIPSPLVAEAMGRSGLDWVTVDLQHGLIGLDAMTPMLQALAATPALSFVRVPDGTPSRIERALDAGAGGVIVPMVASRTAAESAVGAARYAPRGTRSWGPTRAGWAQATTDPPEGLIFAMIETEDAVAEADMIAATPGLDGILVGTSDLAVSLGLPAGDALHPRVRDAAGAVSRACRAAGVAAAIGARTSEQVEAWLAEGFTMLSLGRDLAFLTDGISQRVERFRALARHGSGS